MTNDLPGGCYDAEAIADSVRKAEGGSSYSQIDSYEDARELARGDRASVTPDTDENDDY